MKCRPVKHKVSDSQLFNDTTHANKALYVHLSTNVQESDKNQYKDKQLNDEAMKVICPKTDEMSVYHLH